MFSMMLLFVRSFSVTKILWHIDERCISQPTVTFKNFMWKISIEDRENYADRESFSNLQNRLSIQTDFVLCSLQFSPRHK